MELTSAALISTSLLCKNKSLWSYSANTELHRNQFIVVRIVVPCIILVMEHLFSFIFLLILGIFNKPSKEVIVNIYSIKDRSGTINFTFKIQFFMPQGWHLYLCNLLYWCNMPSLFHWYKLPS